MRRFLRTIHIRTIGFGHFGRGEEGQEGIDRRKSIIIIGIPLESYLGGGYGTDETDGDKN